MSDILIPQMVDVPAGPFWMGSERSRDPQTQSDELWHEVTLGAYQIGMYPVTVAEYACAVDANAVLEPHNWQEQLQHPDHPVVFVFWRNARNYISWLCHVTGDPGWRLPTEEEWEKAARGTDGRIYPWGDTWDNTRANTLDGGPRTTTPVGSYLGGISIYDCYDMLGNVWEWTSSIYFAEAYQVDNLRKDSINTASNHVFRGGSWNCGPSDVRAACRDWNAIDRRDDDLGFRVAHT